jgi:hypothetical protein
MNADQKRRLNMLGEVAGFRKRHNTGITAGSKLAQFLDQALAAETEATSGGTEQTSGDGAARAGTETKQDLYQGFLDDLRAIRRTARTVSRTVPGATEQFRLPRSISQFNILTTARAFLKDAKPLEAEFLACEMDPDFLKDLEDDIEAYDKAADSQGDGKGRKKGATRTIAEAISDGCDAVRDADPLVKNKYRNQPAVLAEWLTASHVARRPQKEKAKKEPA